MYTTFPSPRGVHVPEAYANDSYRPQRRNRYSRSVQQTPRIRDVTWISSSAEQTPQTPLAPWQPSSQVTSSPAHRPLPSPAPTVGEHMAVDDIVFYNEFIDPYRPQRQRSGKGLFRSFWNGLKKLSGYQSTLHFPQPNPYESETLEMPVPGLVHSEMTQYVNPTPSETEEQEGATPYTSPYAPPAHLSRSAVSGSLRASPVPSMPVPIPRHTSLRGSPVPVPSVDVSPYVRPTNIAATPAVVPVSLRASPAVPAIHVPPITVVSPSIPPSPRPSTIQSAYPAGIPRNFSPDDSEPSVVAAPIEDGSQTLHEPVYAPLVLPPLDTQFPSVPIYTADGDRKLATRRKAVGFEEPLSPQSSLASTIARLRRFIASLDDLPWTDDARIVDDYVPEQNPRSRLRRKMRKGAEPSWYNARPDVEERRAYLSEWDMWAMQSTAALWDETGRQVPGGQWGVMYPHGYAGQSIPPR